jgi:hypothetical protein
MSKIERTTVAKHIIIREKNENEGQKIWCAWEDCDQYGYEMYQTVINEAKPGFAQKLARYVFCSPNHKYFFDHSHIPGEYGKLRGTNPRFR